MASALKDTIYKFCVVEYYASNILYVSAIPTNWIISEDNDKIDIYWPVEKLPTARKQRHVPNSSWKIIEDVTILGKYATFKEALCKEQKCSKSGSESSSDCGSVCDTPKNRRKIKSKITKELSISPPPIMEEEEEESNFNAQSLNNAKVQVISENINDLAIEKENEVMFDVSLPNISTFPNLSNLNIQDLSNHVLVEKLDNIENKIDIIFERISNIERDLHSKLTVKERTVENELLKSLPINSIASLELLEDNLNKSDDLRKQMYAKLQCIGGKDERKCISRNLEKIFTNNVGQFCSWTGRKDNYKLSNLTLMAIIKDAVKYTFPSLTEIDFEKGVQMWFQHAKTRLEREK